MKWSSSVSTAADLGDAAAEVASVVCAEVGVRPDLAVVFVSPHPGQGVLLMNGLDPSVTDEDDAFSCDPALDPFDPGNGFRRPPQSSRDS